MYFLLAVDYTRFFTEIEEEIHNTYKIVKLFYAMQISSGWHDRLSCQHSQHIPQRERIPVMNMPGVLLQFRAGFQATPLLFSSNRCLEAHQR